MSRRDGLRSLQPQRADGPSFEVTFRGYERNSVDEYLAALHQMLLDSEGQVEDTWQAMVRALGDKAAAFILDASQQAGSHVLDESQASAAQLIEDAEQEASEVLRPAHEHAEKLRDEAEALLRDAEATKASALEEAQAEAERKLIDTRRQLEALQETITDLAASKADIMSDLVNLRQFLAGADTPGVGGGDRQRRLDDAVPEGKAPTRHHE